MENAFVVTLSEHDFSNAQLFDDSNAVPIDIGPEVKFLPKQCIAVVCPLKIVPNLRNGYIKVQILILMQNPGNKVDKYAINCILIRSELDLHRPELHKPPNVIVGWGLEPH